MFRLLDTHHSLFTKVILLLVQYWYFLLVYFRFTAIRKLVGFVWLKEAESLNKMKN